MSAGGRPTRTAILRSALIQAARTAQIAALNAKGKGDPAKVADIAARQIGEIARDALERTEVRPPAAEGPNEIDAWLTAAEKGSVTLNH